MQLSAEDLYEIEGHGLSPESSAILSRWSLDDFRSEILSPLSFQFYCDDPLGFVLYRSLGAEEIEIMNLAVREKGVGGGRRLMALFLGSLNSSVRRVLLELRAGNRPALGLYEVFGFRVMGRRPRYYKNGEDAILMELLRG